MIRLSAVDAGLSVTLRSLLIESGESALAEQVQSLEVVSLCGCGDDFCSSFYTAPRPDGSYGQGHRNVALAPNEGMLILDVVNERIVYVEVLFNQTFRKSLFEAWRLRT